MANNDPRIKAYADSVYVKARTARLAQSGRDKPVDVTQIPRLATVLPESRAANDVQLQEHRAQQVENKYSFIHAARSGWRQPPGTQWAKSKDELINGPAKRP